ncbi:MAG: HNH endonuclease signature motif containing protein [Thermoplasmatota archaeon]
MTATRSNPSDIVETPSRINYDYITIQITESRIDKGLIAIPRPLTDVFPEENTDIQVYLGRETKPEKKNYTSYKSSTRESRIGGMSHWFEENNIQAGDEVVIQVLDRDMHVYRLMPEEDFIHGAQKLQQEFDAADNETKASQKMQGIQQLTGRRQMEVALREFHRLTDDKRKKRQVTEREISRSKESIPYNLKVLLRQIYQGHCQVCDFTFFKSDYSPYFEVHHIHPDYGHHPKNLLVVCGNCHNRFEYAASDCRFDTEGWLQKVSFNNGPYRPVRHVLPRVKLSRIKRTYL